MILKDVLRKEELREIGELLAGAEFVEGAKSAGTQARRVKRNRQLAAGSPAAERVTRMVEAALSRSNAFFTAALPRAMTPALVNRHEAGMEYGLHVDNAFMHRGKGAGLRSDLAATLFLSDPKSYDGGELAIHLPGQVQRVKLPAGHLFLYPANTRHRVEPVTRGVRLAAVFWTQSMVRDAGRRQLLFDLDHAIRSLTARDPEANELVPLSAVYHGLMREWMEV